MKLILMIFLIGLFGCTTASNSFKDDPLKSPCACGEALNEKTSHV